MYGMWPTTRQTWLVGTLAVCVRVCRVGRCNHPMFYLVYNHYVFSNHNYTAVTPACKIAVFYLHNVIYFYADSEIFGEENRSVSTASAQLFIIPKTILVRRRLSNTLYLHIICDPPREKGPFDTRNRFCVFYTSALHNACSIWWCNRFLRNLLRSWAYAVEGGASPGTGIEIIQGDQRLEATKRESSEDLCSPSNCRLQPLRKPHQVSKSRDLMCFNFLRWGSNISAQLYDATNTSPSCVPTSCGTSTQAELSTTAVMLSR